ncbi:hypothetical protein GGF50DRAFT_92804 [Schizophyllum commune]
MSPDVILDFAADGHDEAILDGEPFERPKTVGAIAQLNRKEGAKGMWLRNSSEDAPEWGIADERLHVFLYATSDEDEGALSASCFWARMYSTSPMDEHDAIAMHTTEDTQQYATSIFMTPHNAPRVERRVMARAVKRSEKEALLSSTSEVQSEEEIMRMDGEADRPSIWEAEVCQSSIPVEPKKLTLVEVFRQHLRLKVDDASQASNPGVEDFF